MVLFVYAYKGVEVNGRDQSVSPKNPVTARQRGAQSIIICQDECNAFMARGVDRNRLGRCE